MFHTFLYLFRLHFTTSAVEREYNVLVNYNKINKDYFTLELYKQILQQNGLNGVDGTFSNYLIQNIMCDISAYNGIFDQLYDTIEKYKSNNLDQNASTILNEAITQFNNLFIDRKDKLQQTYNLAYTKIFWHQHIVCTNIGNKITEPESVANYITKMQNNPYSRILAVFSKVQQKIYNNININIPNQLNEETLFSELVDVTGSLTYLLKNKNTCLINCFNFMTFLCKVQNEKISFATNRIDNNTINEEYKKMLHAKYLGVNNTQNNTYGIYEEPYTIDRQCEVKIDVENMMLDDINTNNHCAINDNFESTNEYESLQQQIEDIDIFDQLSEQIDKQEILNVSDDSNMFEQNDELIKYKNDIIKHYNSIINYKEKFEQQKNTTVFTNNDEVINKIINESMVYCQDLYEKIEYKKYIEKIYGSLQPNTKLDTSNDETKINADKNNLLQANEYLKNLISAMPILLEILPQHTPENAKLDIFEFITRTFFDVQFYINDSLISKIELVYNQYENYNEELLNYTDMFCDGDTSTSVNPHITDELQVESFAEHEQNKDSCDEEIIVD